MRHYDIQAPDIHPFAFVQDADPALDIDNGVGPNKVWFRTTDFRVLVRNDYDDDWILVGGD
jgi:hypothetical protein